MSYRDRAEDMAETLRRQLRARGAGLEAVAAHAGRRLPRRLHAEVAVMVDAARREAHPRLRPFVDPRRVDRAEKRLYAWLGTRDPRAELRGTVLDRIAGVAFILALVALAYFVWALTRGAV